MRIVAMYRVSTEKQANEGASLAAQQRRYHELAAMNGWHTCAEFRGCESATKASKERQVLQRALQAIRDYEADAIYVHEQSRLTRGDELEVALLLRELRERGCKVIVGGVIRDLTSVDEQFVVGIQTVVDRTEALRIKERSRRGKREKAKQGLHVTSKAPYGYVNPPRGDHDRGRLRPHPDEAPVVRDLFRWRLQGMSLNAILDRLNDNGIRGSKGGRWSMTSLRRTLQHPVYKGWQCANVWVGAETSRGPIMDLKNPDAIIVKDAHEPLVSESDWDQVQTTFGRPGRTDARLLTGLLRINGQPVGADSNGRGRYYYAVRGHAYVDLEEFDRIVWEQFVRMASSKSFLRDVEATIEQRRVSGELDAQIDEMCGRAKRLRRRLDQLIDMRADGEITKSDFTDRAHRAREEMRHAQQRVEELERVKEHGDDEGRRMAAAIESVRLLIHGDGRLSTKQRRRLMKTIVDSVEVTVIDTGKEMTRASNGRFEELVKSKWTIDRLDFRLSPKPASGSCGANPRMRLNSYLRRIRGYVRR